MFVCVCYIYLGNLQMCTHTFTFFFARASDGRQYINIYTLHYDISIYTEIVPQQSAPPTSQVSKGAAKQYGARGPRTATTGPKKTNLWWFIDGRQGWITLKGFNFSTEVS